MNGGNSQEELAFLKYPEKRTTSRPLLGKERSSLLNCLILITSNRDYNDQLYNILCAGSQ